MLQLVCRRLCTAGGQYRTVLMYEKHQTQTWLYMLMGGSSVLQLVTWSYLSHYAYKRLGRSEKFFRRWRTTATVVSLLSGVFFAVIANMYCLRSVKRLELVRPVMRGHKTIEKVEQMKVRFTTFTPLGSTREFDVPLQTVHRRGHKADSNPQLALKVRNYPLNFYLDKRGSFTQTFDIFINLRT